MEELRKKVRDKLIAAKPTKDVNAESDLIHKIIQIVREQVDECKIYTDTIFIDITQLSNCTSEYIAYITDILFDVHVIGIYEARDSKIKMILQYNKEAPQQRWKDMLNTTAFRIPDYGMRYWLHTVFNIDLGSILDTDFVKLKYKKSTDIYQISGQLNDSTQFLFGISKTQLILNIKKADEEIKRIRDIADNLCAP